MDCGFINSIVHHIQSTANGLNSPLHVMQILFSVARPLEGHFPRILVVSTVQHVKGSIVGADGWTDREELD